MEDADEGAGEGAAGAEDVSGDPAPVDDVLQVIFASQEGEDALWRELFRSDRP